MRVKEEELGGEADVEKSIGDEGMHDEKMREESVDDERAAEDEDEGEVIDAESESVVLGVTTLLASTLLDEGSDFEERNVEESESETAEVLWVWVELDDSPVGEGD